MRQKAKYRGNTIVTSAACDRQLHRKLAVAPVLESVAWPVVTGKPIRNWPERQLLSALTMDETTGKRYKSRLNIHGNVRQFGFKMAHFMACLRPAKGSAWALNRIAIDAHAVPFGFAKGGVSDRC